MGRKITIEDIKIMAIENGFECVSNKYNGLHGKLSWKCLKNHQWDAEPNSIKYGSGCPYCAGKNKTIEDMQDIAKSRGGKCLSTVYVNNHTKLQWECADGHRWWAILINIQKPRWCPTCAFKRNSELKKLTIEHMQEIAESRGGECLSTVYVDYDTKLKFKCEINHHWEATPKSIKQNHWCPICNDIPLVFKCGLIFEKLCKEIFLSIGITGSGINSKKYRFTDDDGIRSYPDFILNNNNSVWIDSKIHPYRIDSCIEKYLPHCKTLIIIHLKGKRENTHNIKFIPIKKFYNRLKSAGKENIINELELLRKNKIPNRFKQYPEQNLKEWL